MMGRAGFASWGLVVAMLAGCAAPRTAPVTQVFAPPPSRFEHGLVVATRPLDAATQTDAAFGIHAVMVALGLTVATLAAPAQEVVVQRDDGNAVSFIATPPDYAPGDHVVFAGAAIHRD